MTTAARKYTIEIHDSTGVPDGDEKLITILENAHTIVYTEAINEAPILSLDLPADDDKATDITKANEIWLRDYEAGTIVKRFRLSLRGDVRR